jgi:hypothetical protein
MTGIVAIQLTIAGALLPAAPAMAQPGGLRDLIGMRGSSAEYELGRRGYTLARNANDQAYWWNSGGKACVGIYVNNGRVQNVNSASSKDCGKGGGSDAAAGAVIGALLVGAIVAGAASSNKHRDRDDYGNGGWGHGDRYGQYSPADDVICYRREATCYKYGEFSSKWTRREFGGY